MLNKEDIEKVALKYKEEKLINAFIEGAEYQREDDMRMIMMLKNRISELANELSNLKQSTE